MKELYPLKFNPIFLERIWGGDRFKALLHKDTGGISPCGESWELSAVDGNVSVVANGFLQGNDLLELGEIYMGDLLGEKVYDKYGMEFPLLIKFIDAADDLSIQVHPDDDLARERHGAYGKTEMWYVLQAGANARLMSGFNQPVDREKYLDYLGKGKLTGLLNTTVVQPGDVFFIPAGRIHAIGRGILLAEIQQTSDVTYRIYDYDRVDKKGKKRKLHTDLALDAIHFEVVRECRSKYTVERNRPSEIVSCPYFTTRILDFDLPVMRESSLIDSFVIYICVGGSAEIRWKGGTETISAGETVLIPAAIDEFSLIPTSGQCRLLEIFIP
jgi:mannose-6-phosphate isomerase